MKYQIQKNIIIMVLGLIILLPMISADTWYDQDGTATGTPTVFIPFLNGASDREIERILHTFIESAAELNPPLVFLRAYTGSQVFTYPGSFPDLEERFQPVKLESLRTG